MKRRIDSEWAALSHAVIERAVGEWRQRLRACVRAGGGHFEHLEDWNLNRFGQIEYGLSWYCGSNMQEKSSRSGRCHEKFNHRMHSDYLYLINEVKLRHWAEQ